MSLRLPEADGKTLANRAQIIADLRTFVPGEG